MHKNQCIIPASKFAATGPVENPSAFVFIAGGSSSGTGALVEIEYGIGTDQGGSIRISAAHCGTISSPSLQRMRER